jgi:hypothetical protein
MKSAQVFGVAVLLGIFFSLAPVQAASTRGCTVSDVLGNWSFNPITVKACHAEDDCSARERRGAFILTFVPENGGFSGSAPNTPQDDADPDRMFFSGGPCLATRLRALGTMPSTPGSTPVSFLRMETAILRARLPEAARGSVARWNSRSIVSMMHKGMRLNSGNDG